MSKIVFNRGLLFGLIAWGLGCTPLAPSNPYDMETDTDLQKSGHIIGRVEFPPVEDYIHDFDEKPVALMVKDETGQFLLDEAGETRTWLTRLSSAAMPERLIDSKNLGPAGTFDIELPAGLYTLVFDAAFNNMNYRYEDVTVYAVTVYPAAYATAFIEPEAKGQPDCVYNLTGVVEGASAGQGYEVQLVNADDVGGTPLRTTPMSTDGPFRLNCVDPAVTYRIRLVGQGYAPALSRKIDLTEEGSPQTFGAFNADEEEDEEAESDNTDPAAFEEVDVSAGTLRLSTLGNLFNLDYDAINEGVEAHLRAESPYTPRVGVHVKLNGGQILLPSELGGTPRAEIRALAAPAFDALVSADDSLSSELDLENDGWVSVDPSGDFSHEVELVGTDLGDPIDGAHQIKVQLRLCLEIDDADVCLESGINALDVILDREGPESLGVSVSGSTEGENLYINCAHFLGATCEDVQMASPFTPIIEADLHDRSGRVVKWAASFAAELPPSLEVVASSTGLALIRGVGPSVAPEDAEQQLRVWAVDAAGNAALIEEKPVTVDITPPELQNIWLNDGSLYAATPEVTLQVIAEGAAHAEISNASDFGNPQEVVIDEGTYLSTWLLPTPHLEGNKIVYVRIQDRAGNAVTGQATIVLDLRNPQARLLIENGAEIGQSHQVEVAVFLDQVLSEAEAPLSCDTVPCFKLDTNPMDCSGEHYDNPFTAPKMTAAVELPFYDGTHEIFACVREPSGRTSLLSDEIIIDTQAPEVISVQCVNCKDSALHGFFINDRNSRAQLALQARDVATDVETVRVRLGLLSELADSGEGNEGLTVTPGEPFSGELEVSAGMVLEVGVNSLSPLPLQVEAYFNIENTPFLTCSRNPNDENAMGGNACPLQAVVPEGATQLFFSVSTTADATVAVEPFVYLNDASSLANGIETGSLATGAWSDEFLYDVSGANYMLVDLRSFNGDADMYVRFDEPPTVDVFDHRPYVGGEFESLAVSIPEGAARVHIKVQAYAVTDASANEGKLDFELQTDLLEIQEADWEYFSWGGAAQEPEDGEPSESESNEDDPGSDDNGSAGHGDGAAGTAVTTIAEETGDLAAETWGYFQVAVEPGAVLTATLESTLGDSDLYVSFVTNPSLGFFDCNSLNLGDAVDLCSQVVPPGVTSAYIGVYGYDTSNSFTLTVTSQTSEVSDGEIVREYAYIPGQPISLVLDHRATGEGVPPEGLYAVSLSFIDSAGNESERHDLNIGVDRTAPELILESLSGDVLQEPVLSLNVLASGDVLSIELANSPVFNDATPVYPGNRDWLVASANVEGSKTIYGRTEDRAGNSTTTSLSVALDLLAPQISLTLDAPGNMVDSPQITGELKLLESNINSSDFRYFMGVDVLECDLNQLVPFHASAVGFNLELPPEDGLHTVLACAQDPAGHLSRTEQFVTLDTVEPMDFDVTCTTCSAYGPTVYSTNKSNQTQMVLESLSGEDGLNDIDKLRIRMRWGGEVRYDELAENNLLEGVTNGQSSFQDFSVSPNAWVQVRLSGIDDQAVLGMNLHLIGTEQHINAGGCNFYDRPERTCTQLVQIPDGASNYTLQAEVWTDNTQRVFYELDVSPGVFETTGNAVSTGSVSVGETKERITYEVNGSGTFTSVLVPEFGDVDLRVGTNEQLDPLCASTQGDEETERCSIELSPDTEHVWVEVYGFGLTDDQGQETQMNYELTATWGDFTPDADETDGGSPFVDACGDPSATHEGDAGLPDVFEALIDGTVVAGQPFVHETELPPAEPGDSEDTGAPGCEEESENDDEVYISQRLRVESEAVVSVSVAYEGGPFVQPVAFDACTTEFDSDQQLYRCELESVLVQGFGRRIISITTDAVDAAGVLVTGERGFLSAFNITENLVGDLEVGQSTGPMVYSVQPGLIQSIVAAQAIDDGNDDGENWEQPQLITRVGLIGQEEPFCVLPGDEGACIVPNDQSEIWIDVTCTSAATPTVTYESAIGHLEFTYGEGLDGEISVGGDWTEQVIDYTKGQLIPLTLLTNFNAKYEGKYQLEFTAIDQAGNESAPVAKEITADHEAPQFDLSVNSDQTYAFNPWITLTVNNVSNDVAVLEVSNTPLFFESEVIQPGQQEWLVSSPSSNGDKTVYVRATDFSGQKTIKSGTVTLDNSDPAVLFELVPNADVVSNYTVNAKFSLANSNIDPASAIPPYTFELFNHEADCGTIRYDELPEVMEDTVQDVVFPTDYDGEVHLTLCLRAPSGRTTTVRKSIIVDTQPPHGSYFECTDCVWADDRYVTNNANNEVKVKSHAYDDQTEVKQIHFTTEYLPAEPLPDPSLAGTYDSVTLSSSLEYAFPNLAENTFFEINTEVFNEGYIDLYFQFFNSDMHELSSFQGWADRHEVREWWALVPETATSGLLRVETSHQGNRVYFENAITQYDLEALPEAFTSSDALPVAPSWEALEENEANYVLNLGERSIDGFSRVDVGFEYEGPANTRARLRAFVYSDADPENQRLIENCNYMEAGANELSECWFYPTDETSDSQAKVRLELLAWSEDPQAENLPAQAGYSVELSRLQKIGASANDLPVPFGTQQSVSTALTQAPVPYVEGQAVTQTLIYNGQNLDGHYRLTAVYEDGAGNLSNPVEQLFEVDHAAPNFEIVINDGATFTHEAWVLVQPVSTASDVMTVEISNSSSFGGSDFMEINESYWWSLSAPQTEGEKTIYMRATDWAGNTSVVSQTVVLDLSNPGFRVDLPTVAGSEAGVEKLHYNETTVAATLYLTDEQSSSEGYRYGFGIGDADCSAQAIVDSCWSDLDARDYPCASLNFDLSSQQENHLALTVCVTEPSGRTSTLHKEIVVDRTGPEVYQAACVDCTQAHINSETIFFTNASNNEIRIDAQGYDNLTNVEKVRVVSNANVPAYGEDDQNPLYEDTHHRVSPAEEHTFILDTATGWSDNELLLAIPGEGSVGILVDFKNPEGEWEGFEGSSFGSGDAVMAWEKPFDYTQARIRVRGNSPGYTYYNLTWTETPYVEVGSHDFAADIAADGERHWQTSVDVPAGVRQAHLFFTPTGDDMDVEPLLTFMDDHQEVRCHTFSSPGHEAFCDFHTAGNTPINEVEHFNLGVLRYNNYFETIFVGEGESAYEEQVPVPASFAARVEWFAPGDEQELALPQPTMGAPEIPEISEFDYVEGQSVAFVLRKGWGDASEEASYALQVYLVDKAGNLSAPQHLTVILDRTSPELSLSPASGGLIVHEPWVELTADANGDPYVGEILVSNFVSLGASSGVGPGDVIGWELNNPSTSGSKTVYASATDYAGNIGLATLVFELDLEQPLVNLHAYSVRSETVVVEDGQPDVRDEWVSLLPSSAEPVLLGTPNAQFIVEVSGANIEYQVGFENFNSCHEWLEAGNQSSCILDAPGEALPLQISVLELSEGNGGAGPAATVQVRLRGLGEESEAPVSNADTLVLELEVESPSGQLDAYSFDYGLGGAHCEGASATQRANTLTDFTTLLDVDLSGQGEGHHELWACLREPSGLQAYEAIPLIVDRSKPNALGVSCTNCNEQSGRFYSNNDENLIQYSLLATDELSAVKSVKLASLYRGLPEAMTNGIPDGRSYVVPGETQNHSFSLGANPIQSGDAPLLSILTLMVDGNEDLELYSFFNGTDESGEQNCVTQPVGFESRCSVFATNLPLGATERGAYVNSWGSSGVVYDLAHRLSTFTTNTDDSLTGHSIAPEAEAEVLSLEVGDTDAMVFRLVPQNGDADLYVKYDDKDAAVCESTKGGTDPDVCRLVPPPGVAQVKVLVRGYGLSEGEEGPNINYNLEVELHTLDTDPGASTFNDGETSSEYVVREEIIDYPTGQTASVHLWAAHQDEWFGGFEGKYEVAVSFIDEGGNESDPTNVLILVDRHAPEIELQINEGAENTGQATVDLDFSVLDRSPLKQVRVSNTPSFSNVNFVFKPVREHTLNSSGGDGERWVYAEVTDAAGNVSDTSDSIYFRVGRLDAPVLKPVALVQGAEDPGDQTVALEWYAVQNASHYRVQATVLGDAEGDACNGVSIGAPYADGASVEVFETEATLSVTVSEEQDCPYLLRVEAVDEWGISGASSQVTVIFEG